MEKTEVITRLEKLVASGIRKKDIEASAHMTKNSLANFMKDGGKRMPQIWVDRLSNWLSYENDPKKGTITCPAGSLMDQTLSALSSNSNGDLMTKVSETSFIVHDGQPGITMQITTPAPAWIKEIEEYCAETKINPLALIEFHKKWSKYTFVVQGTSCVITGIGDKEKPTWEEKQMDDARKDISKFGDKMIEIPATEQGLSRGQRDIRKKKLGF